MNRPDVVVRRVVLVALLAWTCALPGWLALEVLADRSSAPDAVYLASWLVWPWAVGTGSLFLVRATLGPADRPRPGSPIPRGPRRAHARRG
jgi:hypothetical protein